MAKNIHGVTLIESTNIASFLFDLNEAIQEYQGNGWNVELQYSYTKIEDTDKYSALVTLYR